MINNNVVEYIENLIAPRLPLLQEMECFAKEHVVPIMELVGVEALLQILTIKKPNRILEVGTAIGYSALRMAYSLPNTEIVTIERDPIRIEQAKQFIKRAEKLHQIHLVEGDALEVASIVQMQAPFDVIFLDAAKGQNQRFFELYTPFLNENGIILTDNVLYKGNVAKEVIEVKRTRTLVEKIKNYNEWLMNHPEYQTAILPVGDGIAISTKRGEGRK